MIISGEYKGYKICLTDYFGIHIMLHDEVVKKQMKSVAACEKWIDDQEKKKFKRVKILFRFGRWASGEESEGEATSLADDGAVWLISKKGERAKKNPYQVLLDTPENRLILDKIRSMNAEINRISEEIDALEESTERLSAEMMIIEEEK